MIWKTYLYILVFKISISFTSKYFQNMAILLFVVLSFSNFDAKSRVIATADSSTTHFSNYLPTAQGPMILYSTVCQKFFTLKQ